MPPSGSLCIDARITYSPSAGKTWTGELPPRVPLGVPRGWRRHHARPQFPDHLLSGLGVRLDLCRVETRQDEPAGLATFTVATRAILRDELVLGLDRRP